MAKISNYNLTILGTGILIYIFYLIYSYKDLLQIHNLGIPFWQYYLGYVIDVICFIISLAFIIYIYSFKEKSKNNFLIYFLIGCFIFLVIADNYYFPSGISIKGILFTIGSNLSYLAQGLLFGLVIYWITRGIIKLFNKNLQIAKGTNIFLMTILIVCIMLLIIIVLPFLLIIAWRI